MIVFLSELNDLKTWAADIGNAYLESLCAEQVYVIAGKEFGDLEGHALVIFKALCGLKSSGASWHARFAECLFAEGFAPCKAEPDIWLRRSNNICECIAVCVDDLAIAMKEPDNFLKILTDKHYFKLKGSGPLSYHLGADFSRDDEDALSMSPKKYIDRIADSYKQMFGASPRKNMRSPLEKGDHPELDASELLDEIGIAQYQSLIGSLQWAVTLGRIDIAPAVIELL
jgi:hypothetical protein